MSIPLIYQEDVAETFIVKRTGRIHHPYDETISSFCHLSKNLWNQAQYIVNKYHKEFGIVPPYEEIDAVLNKKNYYKKDGKIHPDFNNYHKLGGALAQQILKVHNKAWKSYKVGKRDYFDNPDKDYTGMPRKPKFKKKDGEFILIFTNQQIKFREKKDGSVLMTFPKNIKDKNGNKLKILLGNTSDLDSYIIERLMWSKFDQVRIIPKGTGYTIEIVYDKEISNKNINNELYQLDEDIIMSSDLGVENIAAITDNIGNRPIVINSDILKAENQWYNKRMAELKSIYDRNRGFGTGCFLKRDKNGNIRYLTNKSGKKLDILTENRNNFVLDSMHKVSRYLVEHALSIKSKTIAFGRNPFWKQKVNMGGTDNQNFVQIPHAKLIEMTRYKAEEYGIDVIDDTEEHTSRCSFLDSESIKHHDVYMGKRIKRGLFVASKGTEINSDVQGSYNILRKIPISKIKQKTKLDNVYPKFDVLDIIEGVVVHGLVPERLSISDLMTKSFHNLGMNYRSIY